MDEQAARQCAAHIHAAARLCEDAGMLVPWAMLLGIAEDVLAKVGVPAEPQQD